MKVALVYCDDPYHVFTSGCLDNDKCLCGERIYRRYGKKAGERGYYRIFMRGYAATCVYFTTSIKEPLRGLTCAG